MTDPGNKSLVPGPHELEWRRIVDQEHVHLWDPKTGLCVEKDCPSKEQE